MSNLDRNFTMNAMATLERQQMLERERAVVQNLHDQGICAKGLCIVCIEEAKSVEKRPGISPNTGTYCPQAPEALTLTLQDRGEKYGDYDEMARVAQGIKAALEGGSNYRATSMAQRESLDVIATKLARIVCGNPNLPDSWHDIGGYAKLAEDRCPIEPRIDWPQVSA